MVEAFTKGPWTAERAVDDNGWETGKVWIIMRGEPKAYDFDRFEDALLASASPDLLSVAKAIDDMWSDDGEGGRCGPDDARSPHTAAVWRELRAAIAKALNHEA